MMKSLALGALLLTFVAAAGYGQVDQGKIQGAIKDSTGGVIPGVMITVKNDRTGEEREALSGDRGDYVVTSLRPSVYTVRASLPGFAPKEVTGVQVGVGQSLTLDLALSPAGVSQELTVSADAAEVRVETSSASHGRERGRAGSGRAADQWPPTFSTVSAGAGRAEYRQRSVQRHSFQWPGDRTECGSL